MEDATGTNGQEEPTRTDGGEAVSDADIYAPDEEGSEYFDSVFRPTNYDGLEDAPKTGDYPDQEGSYGMAQGGGYKVFDLPKVPKIRHIVGPSAIMLGAALGSGETLFWPTLIASNGWALWWAFWVGVATQFFINTEIQRWSMATGESIFRAYERIHLVWPWFFLLAGFFHVGWPGWVSGAGEVGAAWVGLDRSLWWAIGIVLFIFIYVSYQIHPIIYLVVEKAQTVLMGVAISFAIILIFIAGAVGQLPSMAVGAFQFGTLPAEMDIAVFLGGLAYAGAGGYINLSQSLWAREKGYGMSSYQGRVKNPLIGDEPEAIHENGITFKADELNMRRWRSWWKVVQAEHFLTFVLGLLIVTMSTASVARQFAAGTDQGAIAMWLDVIAPQLGGVVAFFLYGVLFIALFSTQYAILEAFVRNSVDIVYEGFGRARGWSLDRTFWALLTVFTLWGIVIIGARFEQPWILLVIGAAIAGVMMWPYNALTIILNVTKLPEHVQPGWARIVAMWWATAFFGYFSVLLIADQLVSRFGLETFATSPAVAGSSTGAYVLWALMILVQLYTMYRTATAKMATSGTVDDADVAQGFLH